MQTNIIRAKDDVTKRLLLADLAASQRNLGLLDLSDGKAAETEVLFKKAISNLQGCLKSTTDGRIDCFVAHMQIDLLTQLAMLNAKLGRKVEALKFFRQAIDLADQSFYPMFLIKPAKDEYARLLKIDNRNQEADALYSHDNWVHFAQAAENAKNEEDTAAFAKNLRAAADAAKGSKSTMHLAVISLKKLAKLQLQQSTTAASRETCMEALHVWKTLAGGADSEADYVMGLLIRQTPSKENAIEVQTSRLKLRRDLYGQNDFHVAETETELASLYAQTGDKKTAKLYADKAYDTFNQLRIKRHGLGVQELTLGKVFEDASDLTKAEVMFSRALAAQMKRHKKNASMISEIYRHLSLVFRVRGKDSESRNAERESRRWRE